MANIQVYLDGTGLGDVLINGEAVPKVLRVQVDSQTCKPPEVRITVLATDGVTLTSPEADITITNESDQIIQRRHGDYVVGVAIDEESGA